MRLSRLSESADRIQKLRDYLGLKRQGQLAAKLGITQAMVSSWETAKELPSASFMLRLATLAEYPDNVWFLEQAGIDEQTILSVAKGIREDRQKAAKAVQSKGNVVLIPRFRLTEESKEGAGEPIPLPSEFVPNPDETICFLRDIPPGSYDAHRAGMFILDTSFAGTKKLSGFFFREVLVEIPASMTFTETPWLSVGVIMLDGPLPRKSTEVSWGARLSLSGTGMRGNLPLIGRYTKMNALEGVVDEADVHRRISEVGIEALDKMEVATGIRILGEVIGQLTGHLPRKSGMWEEITKNSRANRIG